MNYKKMTKAQLIEELQKKPEHSTMISNCSVENNQVMWDAQALESVNNVSEALLNMTELFKAQKMEIIGFKITQNNN